RALEGHGVADAQRADLALVDRHIERVMGHRSPQVIPEAAKRLSGIHSAGAWRWIPALRFASAGMTAEG
ncbi:MAG TPA: hypothetical protein VKB16_18315, partial [Beijerinckiaceae bacterium]|nr:hypothetical protein [Beijerinckiaceae bacterium]